MRNLIHIMAAVALFTPMITLRAAEPDMPAGWSKEISATQPSRPDTQWFRDAKFGIFMHWGLYSEAGNVWKGKDYYGSGEWLMNRGKIPVKAYEKLAATFNPTHFNADDWAKFVHDAGAHYLVITAKHHEGFAMFKSNAPMGGYYNIVDDTPYGKDPMAPLADACRKNGVHFGFYYSQYLDWHEKDGGGNTWDFKKSEKDVKKYYAEKSMPQIRELASNYGPLSILWFDMPGGLTKEETATFVADIRKLQPNALISSRVGQGLGDFSDLGDSEFPPTPIAPPWEALFTHTDSWGFQKYDQNFKSPTEIIHLLASVAARGGNLILNVGPDGEGNIPEKSREYLTDVGNWLKRYGESIYGTTASPIPDQPWGVMTAKPHRLFLHLLNMPRDVAAVPAFSASVKSIHFLNGNGDELKHSQNGELLTIVLPQKLEAAGEDAVIEVDYDGELQNAWGRAPSIVSQQLDSTLDASVAHLAGNAKLESKTSSRYFGNWHHDPVITSQRSAADAATFKLRVLEGGDYKLSLEYACPDPAAKNLEGAIDIHPQDGGGAANASQTLTFQTCATAPYDSHQPLVFFRHPIAVVTLKQGDTTLAIHPMADVPSFFWLHRVILERDNDILPTPPGGNHPFGTPATDPR